MSCKISDFSEYGKLPSLFLCFFLLRFVLSGAGSGQPDDAPVWVVVGDVPRAGGAFGEDAGLADLYARADEDEVYLVPLSGGHFPEAVVRVGCPFADGAFAV